MEVSYDARKKTDMGKRAKLESARVNLDIDFHLVDGIPLVSLMRGQQSMRFKIKGAETYDMTMSSIMRPLEMTPTRRSSGRNPHRMKDLQEVKKARYDPRWWERYRIMVDTRWRKNSWNDSPAKASWAISTSKSIWKAPLFWGIFHLLGPGIAPWIRYLRGILARAVYGKCNCATKEVHMRRLSWFFLFLVLVAGMMGRWLYQSLHAAVDHEYGKEYVTIEYGSTSNGIIKTLADKGIIQSPRATKLYLRFFNRSVALQAGDYVFPSPVSPIEAIRIMGKGRKRTEQFTVLEGWTRFEIAEAIVRQFPDGAARGKADVLAIMENVRPVRELDAKADNLEGYLYPETYSIESGATAQDVVDRLVKQFKEIWQPKWTKRAKAMGRTPREIVTIASLIENESRVDEERPLVASVIYNRLKRRMPLGIDATNVYAAKMLGRWDGIFAQKRSGG
jgi:UPF0755 protein